MLDVAPCLSTEVGHTVIDSEMSISQVKTEHFDTVTTHGDTWPSIWRNKLWVALVFSFLSSPPSEASVSLILFEGADLSVLKSGAPPASNTHFL